MERTPVEPSRVRRAAGYAWMRRIRTGTTVLLAASVLRASPALAQTGAYTLSTGTASDSGRTYAATAADQSAVYVFNSAQLTLTGCTMTKTGDASNANNSSQYGTNAGVLAKAAGIITIVGGTVTTNASGANGLFATGTGSSVSMSNGTINASGGGAHGVDVTYGGSISLTSVDITTTGSNSSAVATDFGGGTVTVTGGTIIASSSVAGSHSAGIYSTGSISVSGASVTSVADCGGVIDGANAITLTNTALRGSVEGFKLWKTAPASGSATVTITGGSVTVTAGDCFYVTGTTGNPASGVLTVKKGAAISASTGNILNVDGSSTASLTVDSDTLTGNLIADNTSTITATLQNAAALTGYINAASLSLDGTSTWTMTSSSYLKTLTDASGISGTTVTNIVGNGHSVHYDSTLSGNKYLGGKVYALAGGGYLTPGSLTSAASSEQQRAPAALSLRQNYPNPFNPTTSISFDIPSQSRVTLAVYDLLGREVAHLIDGTLNAGTHIVLFDGSTLASGVYFYRLAAGNVVRTKRMVLQK